MFRRSWELSLWSLSYQSSTLPLDYGSTCTLEMLPHSLGSYIWDGRGGEGGYTQVKNASAQQFHLCMKSWRKSNSSMVILGEPLRHSQQTHLEFFLWDDIFLLPEWFHLAKHSFTILIFHYNIWTVYIYLHNLFPALCQWIIEHHRPGIEEVKVSTDPNRITWDTAFVVPRNHTDNNSLFQIFTNEKLKQLKAYPNLQKWSH